MSLAGELRRRLDMLLHRDRFQRELDEEMRLHVELRRQQQMASGLTPEAAHQSAQRRFGNITRITEKSHMAWGWDWLETFLQDAGYGIRSMRRTPAITAVALISLALGIGANTAIFSLLDAVMLRSLPVKDPQQLVKLGVEDWDGITDSFACTELYSYPFYRQFQRKNAVFSDTAAIFSLMNDVHGFVDNRQGSELIHVQAVSGTYFQTLGVGAQTGRMLNDADDSSEGDHPVVVISDGFWKRNFGSDPSILTHKLKLGSIVFDIVGIAPAEFFGTTVGEAPDAWAPLSMAQAIPPGWGRYKENFSESLYIVGRLKPGVTIEQATANVGMVAVFLSCIGLYGLMSYLVGRRTGEIGIRMALGANRSEVGWQVMREIGFLVLAGIVIGVPVTLSGIRLVRNMLYGVSGTDRFSLTAAIVLLLSAGLAAGYLPARRASRIDPVVALRDE